MFPFPLFRIAAALLALLCLPAHLQANPQEAAVIVADPAPVVALPEEAHIRAEMQPAPPLPQEKRSTSSHSVLSLLSMLPDEKGSLSVDDVSHMLQDFTPYHANILSREMGTLWLHLNLADVRDEAPHTLWLDLGTQVPSGVSVWLSSDGGNWSSVQAEAAGVYEIFSAGKSGHVLIRMDGLPGLWFCPALCSLPMVMRSPERLAHVVSLAAMGILSALCLLFCLTERGEGRFWTASLALAALAQRLWSIPSAPAGSIEGVSFIGMFAAGVALFMLPHAGRVLMRTRTNSPSADVLYLVFALPGACAAIVPLLPGMAWTARLLSLWPLAALLYLVPALLLTLRGVQGSASFLFSCLFMGGGAAVSLWGMIHGQQDPWWGVSVLAGQVLGLLFLASAAPHKDGTAVVQAANLEISERHMPKARVNTYKDNSRAALRRAFRGTIEELFDEACRLDQALTRAGVGREKLDVMTHADGMVAAARKLSESALGLPAAANLPEASLQVFDLHQVIRRAFTSVFEEAEKKGLGLAWYAAPQLGQKFKGDASRLTALLSLLLADSVRASSSGAVSLHVRRLGTSTHPGHLQFTVSDNGEGLPPRGRQSMLIARAWELAAAHGGDLFIDSTPQGMELSFSMECVAMEADGTTEKSVPALEAAEAPKPQKPVVILASPYGLSRQIYAHYLEDMGFCLWEARDAEETAALYAASPAVLVVFDGNLIEEDMVQALAAIRMFEGEQALKAAPFLLLARDDMQAKRIAKAGCDESLILPVVRRDLRAMVRWLISPTPERPVLSVNRITMGAVLAGAHSGSARMQRKVVRKAELSPPPAPAVPLAEEQGLDAAATAEDTEAKGMLSLPPEKESYGEKKSGNWLSFLFRTRSHSAEKLECIGEPAGSAKAEDTAAPAAVTSGKAIEDEVVDLLAEEVLVKESCVQELTSDDLASAEGDGQFMELDSSLICEKGAPAPSLSSAAESSAPMQEAENSEDMESPSKQILDELNCISEALRHGDVQTIRDCCRWLSATAARYGMHTLSDMTQCFLAAWEEGDADAAAQIVEEMRAEAARL